MRQCAIEWIGAVATFLNVSATLPVWVWGVWAFNCFVMGLCLGIARSTSKFRAARVQSRELAKVH